MLSGTNIRRTRNRFNNCREPCKPVLCCDADFNTKYYNDCPQNDYECNDRECHCYKQKIVNLNVELLNKIGHPLAYRIRGDFCFAVDGTKGKTLYLERGFTYIFNLTNFFGNEEKHNLYFTLDPLGGSRINPIAIPRDSIIGPFTISLYISKLLPSIFYYQSTSDTALGGLIIIKEPEYCPIDTCSQIKNSCSNLNNNENNGGNNGGNIV